MKKIILAGCFSWFVSVTSYAEIKTDGSVGVIKTLPDHHMLIPQSLGATVGNNLFHSFETFNINVGESATFTGADNIKNVMSRVTGGQVSKIDGLLRSTIGHANFYFINPAGVTFGAGAKVDVPAAFHVSTADTLRFTDGSQFSVSNPNVSNLTIAEPASFGFLGKSPANIGKISIHGSQLDLKKGQTLDLVARNFIVNNDARLTAPNGEIRFVAIRGKGGVDLQKTNKGYLPLPNYRPSIANTGNITFDGNNISTESNKGGRIEMWGNNIILKNAANISSSSSGRRNAGIINITANHIDIRNSNVSSNAGSMSSDLLTPLKGKAGFINLSANQLSIRNGKVSSDTSTNGNAGIININARKLNLFYQGFISSDNSLSNGDAGAIKIKGDTVNIFGGFISAGGIFSIGGNTGSITLNTNKLNIFNGGQISVQGTVSFSSDIGSINIDVNQLKIDSHGSKNDTGIFADILIGEGKGGQITVQAQNIDILNNGKITATSDLSEGNAGSIIIEAQKLNLLNNGSITSETTSNGNAGSIFLTASEITLNNAAIKTTAKSGESTGQGGSITLNATHSLTATNSASISSSTSGTGQAGNITIDTPNLVLDTQAEISASAADSSQGRIGTINLNNVENVYLNNGGKISVQNDATAKVPQQIKPNDLTINVANLTMNGGIITATTSGNVNAGNIFVTTQNPLEMSSKAFISSDTLGAGHAGNVVINTPSLTMDNAFITATTTKGDAGSVTVNVNNAVTLKNQAVISSSTASKGSAGSVTVTAPVISIDNSSISAAAIESSSGQTGNINVIATKSLQLTNDARISIRNGGNNANPSDIKVGVITVSAPDIDLKNSTITAESIGNVDAGNINIDATHQLQMNSSFISTSATDGNGGSIAIKGGELINLKNSGFLTSVTGANGNGGNINVAAKTLIMNSAAIQANAQAGTGGDIGMNLNTLIPSQGTLIKGGTQVLWQPNIVGFNVIQAASATGVSGNINLTSPQFDISGSINRFEPPLPRRDFNQNPCQGAALESSLMRRGKGSMPITDAQQIFVAPIRRQNSPSNPEIAVKKQKDSGFSTISQAIENHPCTAISF